jgi:hypothetical protein
MIDHLLAAKIETRCLSPAEDLSTLNHFIDKKNKSSAPGLDRRH